MRLRNVQDLLQALMKAKNQNGVKHIVFFLTVLDYIKANMSKQSDQNEAAAEKIRGLLKDYEAKLKDLDKALKDAVDQVKNANAQNGLNAKTLEELQVIIKKVVG